MSEQIKHSPGPWRIDGGYHLVSQNGIEIATLSKGDDFEDEQQANARLLSAAPELLEADEAAIQCIVDFLECYKNDCARIVMDEAVKSLKNDALPKLRAAVAKAENEVTP